MIHTLGYADDLALVEDGDDFQQYLKGVLNLQGFWKWCWHDLVNPENKSDACSPTRCFLSNVNSRGKRCVQVRLQPYRMWPLIFNSEGPEDSSSNM